MEEGDDGDRPVDAAGAAAERAAWWTFVAALVAAVPIILWRGHDQWFFQDEWPFLADRDGGDLHDLLRPHNEHWSTIPVVAYRVLWNVVGLRSYLPYQLMAVGAHLTCVVLLRAVVRRHGARGWIATAAAVALLFYGTGYEVLVWGVLIGFSLSVAGGLGLYLVADAARPSPARLAAASACGLGSLMSSGTGLVVIAAAAAALWARRGLRTAVVPLIPLVVAYGAWSATAGRDAPNRQRPSPGVLADFTWTGLRHAAGGLVPHPVVGLALAVAVATGLAATVLRIRSAAGSGAATWEGLRRGLLPPVAMAAAAVLFFVVTGVTRADLLGVEFATRPRYAYVATVLALPLVGVGLQGLVDRWPRLLVPAAVLLLAGVPGGIADIEARGRTETRREVIVAMAHDASTAAADPTTAPFAGGSGERFLTTGWLHDGAVSGRIPAPDLPVDPQVAADVAARTSLAVGQEEPERSCPLLDGEVTVTLGPGSDVAFQGAIEVSVQGPDGTWSAPREVGTLVPRPLASTGPEVTIRVRAQPERSPRLCS